MTMLSRLFPKKPKIQCVAAHLYNDKIVLVAEDKVKDGYWVYTDHHAVLNPSVDNNILGEKIRHLADQSKTNVRNPQTKEEYKEIGRKLLNAGNFKTQKESRQGKYCNIKIENDTIEIAPTKNEGSQGHQYFKAEFTIENDVSNTELGRGLRKGWEICE